MLPSEARRIRQQLAGVLGTESAETGAGEVEQMDEANTASAEATDQVGATVEINKDNQEGELLQETLEAGDEIEIAIEAAGKNGGMTKTEAAFARLAIGQIVGKYGVKVDQVMLGTESFGGTQDRAAAHKLATESVAATFQAFWEQVKAQFLKAWNTIRGAIRSFFDKAASTSKRAEGVRARAEGTNGSPANSTIELAIAGTLGIGGQVTEAIFTSGLADIQSVIDKGIKVATKSDINEQVKGMEAGLEKILNGDTSEFIALVELQNEGTADFTGDVSNKTAPDSAVTGKIEGATYTGRLLGDRTIGRVAGKAGEISRDMFAYNVLTSATSKATPKEAKAVPVLSVQAINKGCESIIDACDIIVSYNKAWQRAEDAGKRLVGTIDRLANRAEKSDTGAGEDVKSDSSRTFRNAVSAATTSTRRQQAFEGNLVSYANTTFNNALAYAERSLNEYKAA